MTVTLKALGVLLTYPTPELLAATPEIGAVLDAERLLPRKEKAALGELLATLAVGDPLELQERYVALFDRGRATSLHLFEHVHGESRERGQAMVDLLRVYAGAGFALAVNELPDYLPALLEFLSRRPFGEAKEMLADCAHILRKIGDALRERDSDYDAVLAALLAMLGEPGLAVKTPGKRIEEEPSVDEEWMDAPVIFGPEGAPGCTGGQPQTAAIKFMPRQA